MAIIIIPPLRCSLHEHHASCVSHGLQSFHFRWTGKQELLLVSPLSLLLGHSWPHKNESRSPGDPTVLNTARALDGMQTCPRGQHTHAIEEEVPEKNWRAGTFFAALVKEGDLRPPTRNAVVIGEICPLGHWEFQTGELWYIFSSCTYQQKRCWSFFISQGKQRGTWFNFPRGAEHARCIPHLWSSWRKKHT